MKKVFIIFIINCSLLIVNCFSQSITWQRLYDIPGASVSYSYATCYADSGNFYSGGSAFINNYSDYRMCVMKLNPYGDTIWTRIIDTLSLEIYAITPTGDGGCIVTGGNDFTVKLSSTGNVVWVKYYGGDGIQLYDIIKTSDGGYIACGSKFDVSTFAYFGYIIKLDLNGNMQWQQIYPTNDIKELNSIIQLPDGNYAIGGSNSDFFYDTIKILFLKINFLGNIILEKSYTILGKGAIGLSINRINNQFVIGGYTGDSTGNYRNTCFIRIDSAGNLLFLKKYEIKRDEVFYDMKIINPNKFIFTKSREFQNTFDSYVMIIDSLGYSIREQSFTLADYALFTSILLMPNGDFVFAGEGRTALPSPKKTFIVRPDSNLYAPPIGISNINSKIPYSYILRQNFPNPFNSKTIIEFEIKKPAEVNVKLFDINGKYIKTFTNCFLNTGVYKIHFEANDFASGVYFYQMLINGITFTTKKMILLK